MASVVVSGDTSGAVTLSAPAVAGTTTITLPTTSGTMALTSQALGNATTTTSATSITLTATSSRVQNISMTVADLNVTLPDATTMDLGGPLFTIYNAGPYSFNLNTNGGYTIAYVNPGETYNLSLSSKTTSNGLWVDSTRGAARLGYITQAASNLTYYYNTGFTLGSTRAIQAVPLTSNSVLIAYNTSATAANAIVATWSGSSWSYGAPVVVSTVFGSNNGLAPAVALSSTTGFISALETASVIYPFSISGTTISIGTKSASSSIDDFSRFTRLSNTTAIYNVNGNQLRCVFYNGSSAPVLGTIVTPGAFTTFLDYSMIDATNGVAIGGNSTNARASTFTVSNVTITSGTGVSWFGGPANSAVYCYASGGTDVYGVTITSQTPNATSSSFYYFAGKNGTVSNGTVTVNNQAFGFYDFNWPKTLGIPTMASNTSGIFVSTQSVVMGTGRDTPITDFSLIVPQNYEPGAGFQTNGISYRNPKYTLFWSAALSSTRYVIVSNDSKWIAEGATTGGAPAMLSNGTSWYLTIADAMS